jgi:hypothetical protein
MIKAHVVTVRPGTSDRYTDSIWIEFSNAERRAQDLRNEFARRGHGSPSSKACSQGWGAWITSIMIEDGAIQPEGKKLKS